MKIFNVTGSLASLGNGLIPSECYTYIDFTATSNSYVTDWGIPTSALITDRREVTSGALPDISLSIDDDYYDNDYVIKFRYKKHTSYTDYGTTYLDGSFRYHYIDPSYVTMHSYAKNNSSSPLQVGIVLPKNILLIRCHQNAGLYSTVNLEGSIYMPLLYADDGRTLEIEFNGTNHVVTSMWDYGLSITVWGLNI